MRNNNFNITLDPLTGCVKSMIILEDPYKMNWCEMPHQWGEISLKKSAEIGRRQGEETKLLEFCETDDSSVSVYSNNRLKVAVKRCFTPEGNFKESYTFQNLLSGDILLRKGEIGIYTPFPDRQEPASVSLTKCSHSHIWCGESEAWVNALRQGNSDLNLGLVLKEGSLDAYSIDGDNVALRKGTRGCIVLNPEAIDLLPGESFTVSWEIFIHKGKEDFLEKIKGFGKILPTAENYTVFLGETIEFTFSSDKDDIKIILSEKEIPYSKREDTILVSYNPECEGEHTFYIFAGEKRTHISFYVVSPLEKLIERRIEFVVNNQQYHREGSALDGAYLIYDNEEKRMYYDNQFADHNACRERLGMALMIARYLRNHKNQKFYDSLMKFVNFAKREILEETTGEVFNEIGKDRSFLRLYNAPWMITLMTELYNMTKDKSYLDIVYRATKLYYEQGGDKFYPNGLSMRLTIDALKDGEKTAYCNEVTKLFLNHVKNMIDTGLEYPEMECVYEQTIVTSPATYIPEMGLVTGDKDFMDYTKEHFFVLDRFGGMQPDFRNNEMAIRYWDDYWFGKSGLYTDTLHYWCCLSARAWHTYSELSGDKTFKKKAEMCIRNCLCLFKEDGSASSNYVLPFATDSYYGNFFDAWANDQDFALYFAMQIL